ncbi:MAG: glycosyltransferase family 2 protein [Acidobacteria bacterium]|nr:glycosyltransferase family 2 protein [Acidobacteriota bacterium]
MTGSDQRLELSVLIHTFNEADQIRDCLRSVAFASEIYLLDAHSTDGTAEIVRNEFPEVRLEQREARGSAAQKNYGIERVNNEWVLVVDADERVTPELQTEIRDALNSTTDLHAWSIPRKNFMLGEWVRYSGLQHDRVTRLFHRDHARYPNRRVHADMIVNGPVGRLDAPFLHYYVRSLDHLSEKMKRYGIWGGAQLFRDGKRPGFAELVLRPAWRFSRDLVLMGGFLDGWRGFILSWFHGYYTFLKYAKAWEYFEMSDRGEDPRLPAFDDEDERWELPWERGAQSSGGSPEPEM